MIAVTTLGACLLYTSFICHAFLLFSKIVLYNKHIILTEENPMQTLIILGAGPVSYTHLDVYKRQSAILAASVA